MVVGLGLGLVLVLVFSLGLSLGFGFGVSIGLGLVLSLVPSCLFFVSSRLVFSSLCEEDVSLSLSRCLFFFLSCFLLCLLSMFGRLVFRL